jgi:methylated-DNA-[protein]-cysteine S-methyltransferase
MASGKKKKIRYIIFPSRVGPMFVAATEKGICNLYFPGNKKMLAGVEKHFGCELIEDQKYFASVKKQLDSYLAGKLKKFDCQVDFLKGSEFQKKVWKAMLRIPYGETRTYQWVAQQAKSPKAFRAAGQACHNNPVPLIVPCHRVIGKDGSMTGYGGPSKEGQHRKKELLRMEGAID